MADIAPIAAVTTAPPGVANAPAMGGTVIDSIFGALLKDATAAVPPTPLDSIMALLQSRLAAVPQTPNQPISAATPATDATAAIPAPPVSDTPAHPTSDDAKSQRSVRLATPPPDPTLDQAPGAASEPAKSLFIAKKTPERIITPDVDDNDKQASDAGDNSDAAPKPAVPRAPAISDAIAGLFLNQAAPARTPPAGIAGADQSVVTVLGNNGGSPRPATTKSGESNDTPRGKTVQAPQVAERPPLPAASGAVARPPAENTPAADTKPLADDKPAPAPRAEAKAEAPADVNATPVPPTAHSPSAPIQTAAAHSTPADPQRTDAAVQQMQAAAPADTGKITAQIQVTPAHHDSVTSLDRLGLAIAAKSVDGVKHFDIRLDPPELGRVQVHLSVDDSGRAQANLVVDKPQTLELLQRDASNLNRALTDAGLDLPNNGLNFTLREQNRQNDGGGVDKGRGRALSVKAVVQTDASLIHSSLSYAPHSARLDIRV